MGIFSSKKVITVSSSALHLVDTSATPMPDAIITAIISNRSIPNYIMKAAFNGMAVKMRMAHKYAKSTYTLGLPTGNTVLLGGVTNNNVEPHIIDDMGFTHDILVSGNVYAPLTPEVAVLPYLFETRGYSINTDEINIYPGALILELPSDPGVGVKVTLDDITLNAGGIDATIDYGVWVERGVVVHDWIDTGVDDKGSTGYYTASIEKQFVKDVDPFIEEIAILDAVNITWDEDCLVAFYQKYNAAGDTLLPEQYAWVYRISRNDYPVLDPTNQAHGTDEFLPVVPIRYENIDLTNPNTNNVPPDINNLYSTSKTLLRKAGLNLERLGDQINTNPDVGDIDHAYVMFGADLQSNHNETLLYLNNFFQHLYEIQQKNSLDWVTTITEPHSADTPQNSYASRTLDNSNIFIEHGLNLTINHDYITSTVMPGIVGDGTIGNSIKIFTDYVVTINYGPGWTNLSGDAQDPSIDYTADRLVNVTRTKLILKTQLIDNTVRTIEVFGLATQNRIYKNNPTSKNRSVNTSLFDISRDINNHNLILPLQFGIAESFNIVQKNSLYADCSLMVINTYYVTKLKWYQSGLFKFIMIIVAVIITIYTGQAWLVGLAAAAAQSTLALVMYLALAAIVSIVVDVTMDWLVSEFGAKFGIIGAVLMTIAAIVLTKGKSGINITGTMQLTGSHVLQGATALISSTNEFLVEQAEEIIDEYEEFTDLLGDAWDKLEEATDLLKRQDTIDPLTFARPDRFKIVINEVPTEFYARCLGLVDNTMFTIHNEIYDFVNTQLELPTV